MTRNFFCVESVQGPFTLLPEDYFERLQQARADDDGMALAR